MQQFLSISTSNSDSTDHQLKENWNTMEWIEWRAERHLSVFIPQKEEAGNHQILDSGIRIYIPASAVHWPTLLQSRSPCMVKFYRETSKPLSWYNILLYLKTLLKTPSWILSIIRKLFLIHPFQGFASISILGDVTYHVVDRAIRAKEALNETSVILVATDILEVDQHSYPISSHDGDSGRYWLCRWLVGRAPGMKLRARGRETEN